ncbi:hypothetical protein UZ36_01330 [Candidatus Nitromaritima sp. SCGC AAA799-C22]|nr:hypothetical protein UZ36_01330 [Candidatus Nitromaritima sp. SCGC AAA799-C22]
MVPPHALCRKPRDDPPPQRIRYPARPQLPQFPNRLWFFFASLKEKPRVLNTHGSLLGYKKYLPKNQHFPYKLYDGLTLKAFAKQAHAVVVSSKLEYEDAVEFGISKDKLHVIPMGIDVDEYEIGAESANEALKLLFVGRIARVRRVELIIEAAARLSIPFHVTLVGGEEKTASLSKGGYIDELKQLCRSLNIFERVHFAGPKPPDQLASFYREADIFVYPSLYENFGQPLLEAAAAGLPIISTPVGIAPEIVMDGETGFLVSGDAQALAERIAELSDSNLRTEMGSVLREKVRHLYGWDEIINRYLEVYRSL